MKISVPYLILATLLAGLATFQVSRGFKTTLERRLLGQLADAAARVVEGVIDIEANHLKMLRTITFTIGVPEALSNEDLDSLHELVFPSIVNDRMYFVEILDKTGAPLATWHYLGSPGFYEESETTEYSSWPLVERILAGGSDDLGNKFAEIVDAPWGLSLYTGGPIVTDQNEFLGIILVGTPLEEAVTELRNISVTDVTVYAPSGEPGASSLSLVPSTRLTSEQQAQVKENPDEIPIRIITASQRNYVEALKALSIRGKPSGWYLGVSLPEALISDIQGVNIWQLLLIFAVGVLALIGLGVLVAQTISSPVSRLVQATERVSGGELDFQVSVQADDEIGFLTAGFNQMVEGLRVREFITEVFGRMVSEDVREAVLHGQIAMGGEVRPVAVLFTDIRGFTSLTETHPAEEVIATLNEFFAVISLATKKHQG
ncbi:MAG: HAMP domain-containing protein, partial [Anaerolineales bacterium]